jgi:hypothetical protein
MPKLDFMILADYVRADHGVIHIIAAGIDTIQAAEVPTAHPVGIAIRFKFGSTEEVGTEHPLRLDFQSADRVLLSLQGTLSNPPHTAETPVHWERSASLVFQITLPIPSYGDYSLELILDDHPLGSIDIRVVPQAK